MPMRSPEEMAIAAYNSGVDHKDKGLKIEATSGVAKDAKERAKVDQAYNGMGFSYRKTGDYAKALEMYDKALTLKPGFPDAIEYRGEAYLGLNRVDDAKQAYLEILAADRKQADTLMAAMQKWIADKTTNPAGVDPAVVSGLETWLKERGEIAKETMAMGMSHGPRW